MPTKKSLKSDKRLKNNISKLRQEKHMSQQMLANLVNCRRETIGRLENEKYNPSFLLAAKISEVFDKKIEEVFIYTKETSSD